MAFTQEKFEKLRPETRAKKCSDLLRELLLQPGKDWKVRLKEYHQLSHWTYMTDLRLHKVSKTPEEVEENNSNEQNRGSALPLVAADTLWSRELVKAYEFWRRLSGLGLEERIYSALNFTDDSEDKAQRIPWIVWCHNLRSAHNVGSIIRTADCFGWLEIWISGYTADESNKAIQSSAMGAQKWMKIRKFEDEKEVFNYLHRLNQDLECSQVPFQLWALETAPEAPPLHEAKVQSRGILVLGNEEFGIPEDLLKECSQYLQIPMYGRKTSLNVANAFSVCAHQVRLKVSP